MPPPRNPALSPSAYANMEEGDRADLLFEYLEDLDIRLCWVDDEMAALGFCAQCIMADGVPFDHDCRERRWS